MADGSAIRAGKAFVEIFGDGSKLQRTLKGVQTRMATWGASITAVGGKAMAAGLALDAFGDASAFAFASAAAELGKTSARTGIAVSELSGLKFAAEASGGSMEGLEHSLLHMSMALTGAVQGGGEANLAFARLGLSARELVNLAPDQAFRRVADAVAGVKNPMEAAARAQAIFGRGVLEFLPLLKRGAAGIDEFQKRAKELGLVTSPEDVATARAFNVMMMELTASLKRVAYEVGRALLPALQSLRAQVLPYVTKTIEWVRANQGLVSVLGKVGIYAAAAGAGIAAFGVGLKVAGAGVGVLRLGLSSLLSPTTLAAGAVAGLGYAVLFHTDAGGKALGYLGRKFGDLKKEAVWAWGGIANALKAGDLPAAANVAWAMLKLGLAEATIDMRVSWTVTLEYMQEALDNTVGNFASTWDHTAAFFNTVTEAIFGPFNGALDQADDKTQSLVNTWQNWEQAIRATLAQLARLPGFEAVIPVQMAVEHFDALAQGHAGGGRAGAAGNARRDELNGEIERLRQELADARAHALGLKVPVLAAGPGEGLGGGFVGGGKAEAAGTFNGFALGRMGGGAGNDAARTAAASEETNRKLEKVIAAIEKGALAGALGF